MNKYLCVLLTSIILILTGCGDKGDTTTGGASAELTRGENTITTDSGGLIYVVYDDMVFVDDVVRFKYAVRNSVGEAQSGTLHWDDNSSSRVRGNGTLKHIYRAPGTYRVAIQPDGEDKLVVGTVVVLSAPDCRPLVIPSFSSKTGFPSSIPNPFRIKKIRNCYDFVAANSSAGNSSRFNVFDSEELDSLELFTGSSGIFLFGCRENNVDPVGNCSVPNRLGSIDGNAGLAIFPSDGSSTCTGFVQFTGDIASLVVSSNEITISCQ